MSTERGNSPDPQESPEVDERELTPEEQWKQRQRRGSFAAGALAMPIIGLGVTLMAVPLGIWYVTTVFKTVIVVIMNMVAGEEEAAEVNTALGNIDPGSMSAVSISLVIVGVVLLAAAFALSYFMLRAYDIERPLLVTTFSAPMATVLVAVVSASIGALGGLMFEGATQTVEGTLSSAPWGIAGFALASIAVSVVIGAGVWWWVGRILRSADTQTQH
ncbi:hypothetical protein [uncultured Agrococcus sp.]|uniref:hypothetical protein n=1 Tax=uncultured Agrococcus sp. TaxID=382258 RepID=UPI0025D05AF3|nr:hypothetical protein [uncultured Agrococcus sp.]